VQTERRKISLEMEAASALPPTARLHDDSFTSRTKPQATKSVQIQAELFAIIPYYYYYGTCKHKALLAIQSTACCCCCRLVFVAPLMARCWQSRCFYDSIQ